MILLALLLAQIAPAPANVRFDIQPVVNPLAARTLVVVNMRFPESQQVADYYRQKRDIPAANVCAVNSADNATVPNLSLADYNALIAGPIKACLTTLGSTNILYIVLSYRFPRNVSSTQFPNCFGGPCPDRAIDSLLGDVWTSPTANPSRNTIYNTGLKLADYRIRLPPPTYPILYGVWRFDGASTAEAQSLIDRALAGEQRLHGIGCFDQVQPGMVDSGDHTGDIDIFDGYNAVMQAGFPTVRDTNGVQFGTAPAPLRCDGAVFYEGWYASGFYNDAFSFSNAIAWHLDSYSRTWAMGAIAHGAAITEGSIAEPGLQSLPRGSQIFRHILAGWNVGDAFLEGEQQLRWMLINMGDPLYTPHLQP